MYKFTVTINEVTNWEEGQEASADYSHGLSKSHIKKAVAKEHEAKENSSEWHDKMTKEGKQPFIYEAEISDDRAADEEEAEKIAKDDALDDLFEKLCKGDYLEPIDFECEIEEVGIPWREWFAHLVQVAKDIAEERRDLTEAEFTEYERDGGGDIVDDLCEKLTDEDAAAFVKWARGIAAR